MIGLESGAHGLGVVVLAPHELATAAHVADPSVLRSLEAVVIAGAAARAGEPARNAFDQRVVVDRDLQHQVQR